MISALLFEKIARLFAFLFVGFFATKAGLLRDEDSTVLSRLSLYLLMPASVLRAFDYDLTEEVAWGLALATLSAAIIMALFCALDKFYVNMYGADPVERGSVVFSNAGALIIPLVTYVLGAEWVIYSTAYLSVQLLFFWTFGMRLFSPESRFDIKKVLLNGNVICIFIGAGMMLFGIRLPKLVREPVNLFCDMVGPMGMLVAGMLAAQLKPAEMLKKKGLYRVFALRMLVYPCIALVVVKALSFLPVVNGEEVLLISFLAGITPTALLVMQFAQLHNREADYAVAINIFSTLACIVTMPLFVMVYEWL